MDGPPPRAGAPPAGWPNVPQQAGWVYPVSADGAYYFIPASAGVQLPLSAWPSPVPPDSAWTPRAPPPRRAGSAPLQKRYRRRRLSSEGGPRRSRRSDSSDGYSASAGEQCLPRLHPLQEQSPDAAAGMRTATPGSAISPTESSIGHAPTPQPPHPRGAAAAAGRPQSARGPRPPSAGPTRPPRPSTAVGGRPQQGPHRVVTPARAHPRSEAAAPPPPSARSPAAQHPGAAPPPEELEPAIDDHASDAAEEEAASGACPGAAERAACCIQRAACCIQRAERGRQARRRRSERRRALQQRLESARFADEAWQAALCVQAHARGLLARTLVQQRRLSRPPPGPDGVSELVAAVTAAAAAAAAVGTPRLLALAAAQRRGAGGVPSAVLEDAVCRARERPYPSVSSVPLAPVMQGAPGGALARRLSELMAEQLEQEGRRRAEAEGSQRRAGEHEALLHAERVERERRRLQYQAAAEDEKRQRARLAAEAAERRAAAAAAEAVRGAEDAVRCQIEQQETAARSRAARDLELGRLVLAARRSCLPPAGCAEAEHRESVRRQAVEAEESAARIGLSVRGMRNEAQLLRDQWLTALGNAAAEDLVADYLTCHEEVAAEEGDERLAVLDSFWDCFARAAQWAQFRTRKLDAERRGRLRIETAEASARDTAVSAAVSRSGGLLTIPRFRLSNVEADGRLEVERGECVSWQQQMLQPSEGLRSGAVEQAEAAARTAADSGQSLQRSLLVALAAASLLRAQRVTWHRGFSELLRAAAEIIRIEMLERARGALHAAAEISAARAFALSRLGAAQLSLPLAAAHLSARQKVGAREQEFRAVLYREANVARPRLIPRALARLRAFWLRCMARRELAARRAAVLAEVERRVAEEEARCLDDAGVTLPTPAAELGGVIAAQRGALQQQREERERRRSDRQRAEEEADREVRRLHQQDWDSLHDAGKCADIPPSEPPAVAAPPAAVAAALALASVGAVRLGQTLRGIWGAAGGGAAAAPSVAAAFARAPGGPPSPARAAAALCKLAGELIAALPLDNGHLAALGDLGPAAAAEIWGSPAAVLAAFDALRSELCWGAVQESQMRGVALCAAAGLFPGPEEGGPQLPPAELLAPAAGTYTAAATWAAGAVPGGEGAVPLLRFFSAAPQRLHVARPVLRAAARAHAAAGGSAAGLRETAEGAVDAVGCTSELTGPAVAAWEAAGQWAAAELSAALSTPPPTAPQRAAVQMEWQGLGPARRRELASAVAGRCGLGAAAGEALLRVANTLSQAQVWGPLRPLLKELAEGGEIPLGTLAAALAAEIPRAAPAPHLEEAWQACAEWVGSIDAG
eukprot:TRINITY_DN490_c1_g1_i1.p1 TRINITY_DN490_c1_g1~~TRINITY_DN490_c1_g1_i1.p1  ORF type:complete len:1328 (+),score=389.84 TRINITY_DN490_c1_g1_i1:65-4048(+)